MNSKIVFALFVVAVAAQLPAEVKQKIQAKIATLSPEAQVYAKKFVAAYQSGAGDLEAVYKNIKAVKEELKKDPKAAAIKTELHSLIPKPGALSDETKQKIGAIIKGLSPAAQAVAAQIKQVLLGNSEDKFEEIHSILAGVSDASVKDELKKAKTEIIKVYPKPTISA